MHEDDPYSLRRDERFLNTPAELLADRIDVLMDRPDPPTTAAVLKVFAEWLDDCEHELTVIVRNRIKGEPDWHPVPPALARLRRDVHRAADQRT